MKTRSGKNKGQRLQKFVVQALREKFGLDEGRDHFSGDIQAKLMGGAGIDIMLSPHAETLIPFDIECKNHEKWDITKFWEQTTANCKRIPLLICKRNRYSPVVFIQVSDFVSLFGCQKDDNSLIQLSFEDFLKLW